MTDSLDRDDIISGLRDLYVKNLDPTYTQAPIVVVDEHDHWNGFRPDCIDRIAAAGVK
ncbi:hypothetical protein [Microbacterium sp. SA39]|uniref:hypothetical protein n=1 Tax=Microbacterium sp. SA39 TaxID=1263625 RepID=UPI00061F166B|nr:hypothetical protein [Microbacterium sp. SA39]KJQ52620.1 hypothetical protein RS85_03513 [Microbacterium sp. SA39]